MGINPCCLDQGNQLYERTPQEETDMKNKLQRALASLALCAVLVGSLTVPASAAGFKDVPTNLNYYYEIYSGKKWSDINVEK